jgi:RsiW-degrading membrane proteinase PrsW (M82 family)
MDGVLLTKLLVALVPVLVLIMLFERLDVFRLVTTSGVLAYLGMGAALAVLSYVANGRVMDGLPIGFTDYSRYVSPVIEETLKALVMVLLFARSRIGFKLDAAIAGFAIGAGFALCENAYFIALFPEANLGVWLVRGFGTAVMHGGATALFAVITHEFAEHRAHREGRISHLHPWVFLPGLMVAIAVHSAFNHLPGAPLVAMAGALVLIPLTLLAVFSKGGATAHDWLEHDHEAHAQMLAAIREGRFADTDEGRAVTALARRFPRRIAAEVGAWIELQLTLVLRAEEVLLAHERGEGLEVGDAERDQFRRLDALGRDLGRAARHAIQPHLRFSRNDLYELNMLRQRVGGGHGRRMA